VTVGNFDGVHRGHQSLVAAARRLAGRVGGPAIVATFDPPPHHVLHPGSERPPLTTIAQRAELLHAAGADHVVVLRTGPALLALSPEAFFEDVLARQLGAKGLAEGYDFRFGRGRAGTNETLRSLCASAGWNSKRCRR
jgi:riboflavin kinase/FMN adenylyltransferase